MVNSLLENEDYAVEIGHAPFHASGSWNNLRQSPDFREVKQVAAGRCFALITDNRWSRS